MNSTPHPLLKIIYWLALVVVLFTGFGNMPLYGRYYIADVPGFTWAKDYFINVNIHILFGSVLLALAFYFFMSAVLMRDGNWRKLTFSGKIRAFLLAVALLTGILMVVKNLPGLHFTLEMLMTFNFTHMGAAVLLMLVSVYTLIFRRPWRQGR